MSVGYSILFRYSVKYKRISFNKVMEFPMKLKYKNRACIQLVEIVFLFFTNRDIFNMYKYNLMFLLIRNKYKSQYEQSHNNDIIFLYVPIRKVKIKMMKVHVQGRKQDFPQDIMAGDISGLTLLKT